jgi:hypothetical protein
MRSDFTGLLLGNYGRALFFAAKKLSTHPICATDKDECRETNAHNRTRYPGGSC